MRTLGVHVDENYYHDDFWLGFTDVWREGSFVEEYGTVKWNLDRLWGTKQPDNGRRKKSEHFVLASKKGDGYPYELYDVDARQKYLAICEIKRDRVTGNICE